MVTDFSLVPIRHGGSRLRCVHHSHASARRSGRVTTHSARGDGGDRAAASADRRPATQSLRPPRSERLEDDALDQGIEDLEQSLAAQQAGLEAALPPAESGPTDGTAEARPPRRNRGALPANLPRVEVLIEPDETACPCCGGSLHVIGEDRAEMLDYVPAQLRVKLIRRPRLGCRACEGTVLQAPAPERPIDGGMATEALIAHVVIGKYCDHAPLYRQVLILARQGVALDRSTLCEWVGRACWWLAPLYELMLSTVLSSPAVFADDTTLPVLDPGRGRTKTGRLWCYAVDNRPWNGPGHPAVAYAYSEDRKETHPAEHLRGFHGLLQTDGYAGFVRFVAANAGVTTHCAGPTRGGNSSTSTPRQRHPLRKKPCAELPRFTRSRAICVAGRLSNACGSASNRAARWSRQCISG